ncbi:MAG: arsenic resistance N-acetyltransferase ArsN2 [Saprospiraceae bacterium]|nr:arsenic resistance N-acetyltransferase ArsN2 [Saprospiraceae bacterium]
MSVLLQTAQPENRAALSDLLIRAGLPVADLPTDLSGFTLALVNGEVVGSAGIEKLAEGIGLLRSVVVAHERQGEGLGARLFTEAMHTARSNGLRDIYLITNTADRYFEKHGFQAISRDEAPPALAQTAQFDGLCPASSVVMKLNV